MRAKKLLSMVLTVILVLIVGIGWNPIRSKATEGGSLIEITGSNQIVNSIKIGDVTVNAYYRPYDGTNGTDAYYSCAAFVSRFYNSVYGIQVSNLWGSSSKPYASVGTFAQVSNPQIGDIVRWNDATHWAIVKEVLGDGRYVIIEQNCHYEKNGKNYAWKDRVVTSQDRVTLFRHNSCGGVSESNYFTNLQASEITSDNAAITASLPSKPYCTEVGFYLSTNSNMSNAVKKPESANCQVAGLYYGMHKWYGNLNANTTYYYQFYAIIGGTEYKSGVGTFTTVSDVQPADNLFSRIWAADVTDTSADLKGDLKAIHTIQNCGYQLSTNPDMSECVTHYESERNNVNGAVISGFGYPLQNWYGTLTKGTTYYYRLFIIEGGVTYMSSVQSFKTSGDSTPPVISSVTVTEIDASGYTLSVRTSDDSGIMKVAFPTWTDANGQDDLKGEWWNTTAVVTPNADGNYVYRINISDHSYESGKYITHVYAYDNNANTSYSPIEVSVYPLQNIYLSEKTIDVSSGDTRVIGVGLTPENTTDNGILTFSSSDTSIATVNEEGIITAVAPGTAIITAQMSGKTATCTVKVDGGNNSNEKNGNGTNSDTVAMLRLYNPNSGEHFYTSSEREKNALVKQGWNYEGLAWEGPAKSNTPVYRLYNPNSGDHHYTPNLSERNKLIKIGWNDEGIGWYSDDSMGSPLYRLYNPNAATGQHHYTMDTKERDKLIRIGWQDEGIGWYGK